MTLALMSGAAAAGDFGLPIDCTPGHDCFLQQFPDMEPGPGAVDPFCGTATYDGHDGTDIRLRSMVDIARSVPVLAMADGRVLRWRDGEPDRLVLTDDDRKAVGSKECGNGVIIDHGNGIEIQYCHMRRGSVAVRNGDIVEKGDRIGEIGASGLTQFPHVHVTVRKDEKPLDPSTGRMTGEGCNDDPSTAEPLFADAVLNLLGKGESRLFAFGLAGATVVHSDLVVSGPPPLPDSESLALVGWAWLQNLRRGDRISIEITGPSGDIFVSRTTEALDRPKAAYSAYVGKRGAPLPGAYAVTVRLMRNEEAVLAATESYEVE